MELSKSVTLVIQGPISIYTMFTLYRYKDVYPIVIVAPRPTDAKHSKVLKEIQTMMLLSENKISLFLYDNEWDSTIYNVQNRYSHFFSTLLGLESCRTEYAIKMRSDEFYSNLDPFVNTVIKNPTKLVTNDVFFRKSHLLFHPSDHLMGGKTSLLKATFGLAKTFCEDKHLLENNVFITLFKTIAKKDALVPAEVYLGAAYLTHISPSDIRLNEVDSLAMMKNHFVIVDSDDLGVMRIAANSVPSGPKEFFDTSYRNTETDVTDIQEYK